MENKIIRKPGRPKIFTEEEFGRFGIKGFIRI